MKTINASSKMV